MTPNASRSSRWPATLPSMADTPASNLPARLSDPDAPNLSARVPGTYELRGEIAQTVSVTLEHGQSMWASKGALMAYDEGVTWQLKIPGAAVSRVLSGEGLSMSYVTAARPGAKVVLSANQTGKVAVWDLRWGPVTRPTQTNHATGGSTAAGTGLAFQVRPLAAQARQQVLVLSQFHLNAALVGASVLSENIQNQRRAIQHRTVEFFFEVIRLAGRQLIIKNNQIRLELIAQLGHFAHLAGANEKLGIGVGHLLIYAAADIQAGRIGQHRQFLQRVFGRPGVACATDFRADQQGAPAGRLGKI